MRKLSIVAATAALLVAVSAGQAGATPPLGMDFEVPTTLPHGGVPGFGPFAATGPAVDAGLICPSGDTIDVFGMASGFQSQTGVNFQLVKQFTCDDGCGEFFVKLPVRIDARGDNFNWVIVGGNGAYDDLHGTGSGIGIQVPPDIVLDLYSGQAHVD